MKKYYPREIKTGLRNQEAQEIGGKIIEKYYPREMKISSRNQEFAET